MMMFSIKLIRCLQLYEKKKHADLCTWKRVFHMQGICATAIKKVCRKLGIAKWPFRYGPSFFCLFSILSKRRLLHNAIICMPAPPSWPVRLLFRVKDSLRTCSFVLSSVSCRFVEVADSQPCCLLACLLVCVRTHACVTRKEFLLQLTGFVDLLCLHAHAHTYTQAEHR
jgi:hypothetical protein